MSSKKLRVAWLADMNVHAGRGGAESNDKAVYEEGIRRGHHQRLLTPELAPQNPADLAEEDLVIVSNASRFTVAYPIAAQDAGAATVIFVHDAWPQCSWRLFYPRAEICHTCPPNHDHTRRLFSRSVLNVFLSPLHLEALEWAQPELRQWPHFLSPSPVDGDVFKPGLAPREPGTVLAVQSLVGFKGAANVIAYVKAHPELRFDFAGGAEQQYVDQLQGLGNVRLLGDVPQPQLAVEYARHESFLHLPGPGLSPFDRTVAEAKLAGCKLILNGLVGAASWPEFKLPRDEYAAWLKGAPARWWDAVEGAL